jgi:hypothetical protein
MGWIPGEILDTAHRGHPMSAAALFAFLRGPCTPHTVQTSIVLCIIPTDTFK